MRALLLALLSFAPAIAIAATSESSAPVYFVFTLDVDLFGSPTPETLTLTVSGESILKPLTRTVTVTASGHEVFRQLDQDEKLEPFWGDKEFMDGCVGYLQCKQKWYFTDLPDALRRDAGRTRKNLRQIEQWYLEGLEAVAVPFLQEHGFNKQRQADVLKEMKRLLNSGFASIAVPISPVQGGATLMYVPSIGLFVPSYDD